MALKRSREAAELETGALNDIMFFLFLFFLMAAAVAIPSAIKISLPTSGKNSTMAKKPIDVYILPGDTVFYDKKYYKVNPNDYASYKPILDKLIKLNEDAKKENPIIDDKTKVTGITVSLNADSRANVQQLVNVMRMGAENGIKMILVTQQEKE